MSEILIVGAGPLPRPDSTQTCSYNLRTAKFARWLAEEGVRFRLVAVDIFNSADDAGETNGSSIVGDYEQIGRDKAGNEALSRLIAQMRPRAILAVSYAAAAMVCEIDHAVPIWADMPGWLPAEAQLKAAVSRDDTFVEQLIELEKGVLERADKISVVSRNQRHATLGELAIMGRLNRRNLDYPLVRVIPSIATDWRPLMAQWSRPQEVPKLPRDAVSLLWAGTYNLWTDVDLLFNLVDSLMRRIPNLHFVSTGGRVRGHNDEYVDRFLSLVDASDHRDRYHVHPLLSGKRPGRPIFRPFHELFHWFDHAALGLCIDGKNLEIDYGSRTRVVDMLAHGLPVAATTGTELLGDLNRAGAIVPLNPDRPEAWIEDMFRVLSAPDRLKISADAGHGYVHENYSLKTVGAELLAWLKRPERAPDNLFRERIKPLPSVMTPESCTNNNPFLHEQALVVWEPQARIEAIARRIVDPYEPSRRSRIFQKLFRKLLAAKPTRLPAITAWWLASRLLRRDAAARWQSRVETWRPPQENGGIENGILRHIGRTVYGRAMGGGHAPRMDKSYNILVANHEYDREKDLTCLPQRIEIEASSACNVRCRMCKIPYVKKPGTYMDQEVFDRLTPYLRYVTTLEIIGEGEPTLNPNLGRFLEIASENECHVRLFTNGTKLTPETSTAMVRARVGNVVFSIFGGDAQTYQWVTGFDLLDQAADNARDLQDIKRIHRSAYPRLHINCPLLAGSLESAPQLVKLASSLRCDSVNFGIAYILLPEMESESLLHVDKEKVKRVFLRCSELGEELGLRVCLPPIGNERKCNDGSSFAQNRFGCTFPWQSVTVRADGTVEVCAYNRKIVGNIKKQSLSAIWNGREQVRFRRNEVTDNGTKYCDTCHHRAFAKRGFNDDVLLPYEPCRYGYR